MIVVSDSSPLIALASVGHLALLRTLYGRVAIPEAVRDEVVGDVVERPGSREVLEAEWIEVIAASDTIERSKQRGIVGAIKPLLDALSGTVGFHLSRRFYDAALNAAGE